MCRNVFDGLREISDCVVILVGNRNMPESTNALDMLGARTISSTGFSFGTDCRDKRVYVSGCS